MDLPSGIAGAFPVGHSTCETSDSDKIFKNPILFDSALEGLAASVQVCVNLSCLRCPSVCPRKKYSVHSVLRA